MEKNMESNVQERRKYYYEYEKRLAEIKYGPYMFDSPVSKRLAELNEMWYQATLNNDEPLADYYKTIQHKQYHKKELLPFPYLSKVYKDIVGYRKERVL